MAAPTGALVTTSGYPIIDPDTMNPREDWPNIQQAQADWLDTHTILTFPTYAALLIARPTMPPGQYGYAYVHDRKVLYRWNGTQWNPAAPWVQGGTAGLAAVAAGGSLAGDLTITFPIAFPAATYIPHVWASFQASRCTFSVVSRSPGSLQVRVNNYTAAASDTGATVYWTATYTP